MASRIIASLLAVAAAPKAPRGAEKSGGCDEGAGAGFSARMSS